MKQTTSTSEEAALSELPEQPIHISIGSWLDRLLPKRNSGARSFFRLLIAAVLGVAGALGSILFRKIIEWVNLLAFPGGILLSQLRGKPWYSIVLPPAIGGLIVGPLVHFLAPEAKGHGVPEVKDACDNNGGRIRPQVALVKVLASGICIGSGGSVGREGPIVQIGSAVGSLLGQFLGIRGQYLKDLVAAGAAAGIAATFNAPIAGVVFCLEIILGRTTARHFSPLIVSSVVSTAVARHFLGAAPAFQVPAYALVSPWELPLYVLLGIAAAVVGVAFTRGLYGIEDLWGRLPIPSYLHGVLGGAVVGVVALWLPQVFGVGYEWIEQVLHGTESESLWLFNGDLMLLLIVAKIFCTSTTIGSGGSGGVFAPSLFLGATLGGLFGKVTTNFMPAGIMASSGAYALVAMGAVVAATTHAPMTSILIVFELTDNHTIILPLMLSCIIGTIVSVWLSPESIYTLKLVRRGANVGGSGREAAIMLETRVETLMDTVTATVRPNASLLRVVEVATAQQQSAVYVTDAKKRLLGVITMDDIASHLPDKKHVQRKLVANDLMRWVSSTARPEDTLARCVERFGQRNVDELPITNEHQQLVGRISRADLLSYYGREVLRQDVAFGFVDEEEQQEALSCLQIHSGDILGHVEVKGALVGQSLRELNLRARFGVSVYAIRRADGSSCVPDASAALVEGETLIVVGPENEVAHIREQAAMDSA